MLWITVTEEVSSFFFGELGRGDGALQAARWPGVGRWEQSYGAEGRGDSKEPTQHRQQQQLCNNCAPGGSFTAPTYASTPIELASVL